MNKKYLKIFIFILLIAILSVIIYIYSFKNKNIKNSELPINTNLNQNEWSVITDCRDIKLYLENGNSSTSGLDNEQDIALNLEQKILSVGLPESLYGPRKRLEVSYGNPNDYKNCSTDVKKLIEKEVISIKN